MAEVRQRAEAHNVDMRKGMKEITGEQNEKI